MMSTPSLPGSETHPLTTSELEELRALRAEKAAWEAEKADLAIFQAEQDALYESVTLQVYVAAAGEVVVEGVRRLTELAETQTKHGESCPPPVIHRYEKHLPRRR